MRIKLSLVLFSLLMAACGGAENQNTSTGNGSANITAKPRVDQNLTIDDRPQRIKDMVAQRGEQDAAAPVLKIIEPSADKPVTSSTIKVKLELSGDLNGYKPHKDPATSMGNHIHVILDNQPYEAYYNIDQPFELRNVTDGDHTLRVFPSRPWHESYKNAGAFQMVKFTVKNGGGDPNKPTTVNGQPVSNASTDAAEGKDMAPSTGGDVDVTKPLLTYSRPKGEYTGEDADAIMIDYWLSNAKLAGDGGEYRIRYTIDGVETKFLDKWEPIWIKGWNAGSHTIRLELIDRNSALVENGGYNSTARKITIKK